MNIENGKRKKNGNSLFFSKKQNSSYNKIVSIFSYIHNKRIQKQENNTLKVDGNTYHLYEVNGVIYYSSSDKKPITETSVPVIVLNSVTGKEYQEDEKTYRNRSCNGNWIDNCSRVV